MKGVNVRQDLAAAAGGAGGPPRLWRQHQEEEIYGFGGSGCGDGG